MLGFGYPISRVAANAAETASEARVRNDASFIRSDWEGKWWILEEVQVTGGDVGVRIGRFRSQIPSYSIEYGF